MFQWQRSARPVQQHRHVCLVLTPVLLTAAARVHVQPAFCPTVITLHAVSIRLLQRWFGHLLTLIILRELQQYSPLEQSARESFRTTAGIRRGCLLSPILLNLYLEKIVVYTHLDHHPFIFTGGRPIMHATYISRRISMLRAAAMVNFLASCNRVIERAISYGADVGTEQSNIMMNNTNNISTDISVNGKKLEEVSNFKYLLAILRKYDPCVAEIPFRIISGMAAMAGLNRIWRGNTISFGSKFKQVHVVQGSQHLQPLLWLLDVHTAC